jgi:phenylacetate-coenzyme A ligase PaaK-like adenylate-forming protein
VSSAASTENRADRLRALLLGSLRSPFYAARFSEIDLYMSADHPAPEFELLARLPILERTDVQRADGLYSPLLCVKPESIVRVHHTSGSSGTGSVWVYDTAADWASIVDAWTRALDLYEISPTDRALVCASYGRFIGFWGLHEALIAREVMTVSGADLDTTGRAALIEKLGITVVAATPSYALVLGRQLHGVEHKVRLVLTSGEPRPSATRKALEEAWSASTADTAGMTEMGTISMVECPDRPGDLHVLDDIAIEEVLHAETRGPVKNGEMGVRVVTPLTRHGMPFIRYWTNDLVVPEAPACNCQLGERVYRGGIRGRTDDMTKIRGVWFLPSMLEELVRGFPEVIEFRSRVERDERELTVLAVEAELDPRLEIVVRDFEMLFASECKRQLGFHPHLTVVEPGTIPRSQGGKTRRFERAQGVPA